MKLFNKFAAATLAIMAFSFVSINAQGLSAGKVQTDLGRQVEKKILSLPYYEVFDYIDYSIDGSTVTLTGKVRNATNKPSAESAVKRIAGVERVVNNIEVLSPGSFDEQLRRNLYARLHNSGGLSSYLWPVNPDVRLIVDRGHITLEGMVRNRGDFNLMNITASGVPMSFSVTNNLKIENDIAP